ncbi:hypothetical protein [Hymenobacter sp. DG01]|nr:hypothetical protein [Hymenobacter sp. DG01]
MQRFSTLLRFFVLFLLLILGAVNRQRSATQTSLSEEITMLFRGVTPSAT